MFAGYVAQTRSGRAQTRSGRAQTRSGRVILNESVHVLNASVHVLNECLHVLNESVHVSSSSDSYGPNVVCDTRGQQNVQDASPHLQLPLWADQVRQVHANIAASNARDLYASLQQGAPIFASCVGDTSAKKSTKAT